MNEKKAEDIRKDEEGLAVNTNEIHQEALDWNKLIDERVEKVTNELKEEAARDPLTSLFNRRAGEIFLSMHFETAKEIMRREKEGKKIRSKDIDKKNLVVLEIDVDNFKEYNDTYGHLAGDKVLIALGHEAKKTLRFTDILIRSGGEEFWIILPEADLDGGKVAAETLRMQIQRSLKKGNTIKAKVRRKGEEKEVDCEILRDVAVSVGVAALSDETETVDDLLEGADKAMYKAKKEGKDRSAVYMGLGIEPEVITVD